MYRALSLLLIISLLMPISGCWDQVDLEELALPLVVAIDVHTPGSADPSNPPTQPSNKLIDVTTLAPNLSPKAKSPASVETISGINVLDARARRGIESPDTYTSGVTHTIIFGEELARKGLFPYLSHLARDARVSGNILFAIASGRGEDILKTPVKNHSHMGTYLANFFIDMQRRTLIPVVNLYQFAVHEGSKGKNPVAPVLERRGDRVIISGVAVFNKDRLVRILDIEESFNLAMLRGVKGRGYLAFRTKEDKEYIDGAVFVSNSRKVQYKKNQQGHNFIITIRLKGYLGEYSRKAPVTAESLKEIEKNVEKQVKTQCERLITKIQEDIKVDCIDISKYALAKDRRSLEKNIDKPEFIQNANIRVEVKVELNQTGEAQ